jgi:nitrite reductase/ring-hydroxylating ferredoxin subunit
MRQDLHPISGALYEEIGDGLVRVQNQDGAWGKFRMDGTWVEGELTHADPMMLLYIAGKDLPPGYDIFWMFAPPVVHEGIEPMEGGPTQRIVSMYKSDPGMVTQDGMRSSAHIDQDFFLDNDRKPERVPEIFRLRSPMTGGPQRISTERYYKKEYHDLEVERIWKRTWQFVCREDDIPNVGDFHVYDIAHLSYIVVRTGPNEFKAHQNVCLHRGRMLKDCSGKKAKEFRCPYHGWTWKLDGSLKEITTEWDFPGVRETVSQLPSAKVATWAGFVFINPDPDAGSLEEFLGPVMMAHYAPFKFENRYKQAHVLKLIRANWKTTMEAFMDAYHVIATHPHQMLVSGDFAELRYDAFDNWSRAGHVMPTGASPQRGITATPEEQLALWRGFADFNREFLRNILGDEVDQYSDAELNDQAFNDLFPNMHPWGGWARICFRFRPNGDNPEECLMDAMLLAPWPEGKPKPPPAPLRRLGPDDPWTAAPELMALAKIMDQDILNIPRVQKGMRAKQPPYVWLSAYQEGKTRNFHRNYEKALGIEEAGGKI